MPAVFAVPGPLHQSPGHGLSGSKARSPQGVRGKEIPAKKWGDTEIAERGRSVLVMRARYRSTGLTPHQRGWTDAG